MEYMIDEITILKSSGRDKWGTPLPATEETIEARVIDDIGVRYGRILIRNKQGEDVVPSAKIIIRGITI